MPQGTWEVPEWTPVGGYPEIYTWESHGQQHQGSSYSQQQEVLVPNPEPHDWAGWCCLP